jgi:hypothetical protein
VSNNHNQHSSSVLKNKLKTKRRKNMNNMISKPAGYDESPAYTGEMQVLPPGAYECVIVKAEEVQSSTGKTQVKFDIDITSGEYKDFFQQRFSQQAQKGQNAKPASPAGRWQGVYYQLTEGTGTGYFKGVIANIESSNPGFKFNWDANTLTGKRVGGVFRREQFISPQDGTLKFSTKCFFLCDISRVGSITPPEDKLLNNGSHTSASAIYSSTPKFEEIDPNDDLPF